MSSILIKALTFSLLPKNKVCLHITAKNRFLKKILLICMERNFFIEHNCEKNAIILKKKLYQEYWTYYICQYIMHM